MIVTSVYTRGIHLEIHSFAVVMATLQWTRWISFNSTVSCSLLNNITSNATSQFPYLTNSDLSGYVRKVQFSSNMSYLEETLKGATILNWKRMKKIIELCIRKYLSVLRCFSKPNSFQFHTHSDTHAPILSLWFDKCVINTGQCHYRPQRKLWEGNVFTGICLSMGRDQIGNIKSIMWHINW